jgi:hypothetical protein
MPALRRPDDSPEGLLIQVVGQKIIAYASIFSVGLMSWGALRAGAALPPVELAPATSAG